MFIVMTLIIAEKPSLARNIVAGIGKMINTADISKAADILLRGHLVIFFLFTILKITLRMNQIKKKILKYAGHLTIFHVFRKNFVSSLKCGENGKPDEGVKKQF